jgi:hypothetical protein
VNAPKSVEDKKMGNDKAPMLAAVSAAFGAFLGALMPSEWPWHFELLTVLAAAVAVYVTAKVVVRAQP